MSTDASTPLEHGARSSRQQRGPVSTTVLGALLGVAMGISNALGYLLVLLLSRTLGPADFGGYTALSTFGVLLAIPAGAFQVVIARRVAGGDRAELTTGLRLGTIVAGVLFAGTVLASGGLADLFNLDTPWSPTLLGAMLLP
ncbi:MAG: hypothetical protein ABI384_02475, partial [Allobranchiibius sp.]